MTGNIPPNLIEPVATAQHFVPPSSRELRAQAVHRLQVGLFGLCAMLLIVGLANIIMDRARLVDAEDPIRAVVAVDAKPKRPVADPLADIGVIPSPEASPTPSATDGSADSAGTPPLATQ